MSAFDESRAFSTLEAKTQANKVFKIFKMRSKISATNKKNLLTIKD
ncbi:hypothetical protein [Helicobacter pylori]|nr:hypothetical protein [Helicobacter pylori]